MKFDTDQNLADLSLIELKKMEAEIKETLSKIVRAKKRVEKAEAKKKAQEVLKAAKEVLKAKETDLKETLTKMGFTRQQINEAVRAMLATTSKAAPKAKRNRGPAKFIYTNPKTKETYTAGKPPKWYQEMSANQRVKIRKDNPARIQWEKKQN